jgi:hypothetical protein
MARDIQLVETVVSTFERLKQQASGISVIRTLQGFLEQRSASGSLCLDIPFFGTIKMPRSGAVQSLDGERLLGANAAKKSPFPRPPQQATPSSMIETNYPASSMPQYPWQILQQQTQNGENHAEDEAGRTNTLLQFSGGYLQLPDALDMQGDLEVNGRTYQESDIIFFDSLVNTDLVGNWTL